MPKKVLALAGAAAAVLGLAIPAAAQETGTVYVVHGIPDTPVDVYVDGQRALDDFAPATTQGPLQLPAGAREVTVFPADAADNSGDPVITANAELTAGANVTLVAHLDAEGTPVITPFTNDVSAVGAGKARLVVRHTAAAPAVDVRAGGTPVISGLTNPNQEALTVEAGTVSADVVLAGTETVAIGPADLDLAEGTATIVHAIGSAEEQTLAVVPLVIQGLHSAPSGVPAGSAADPAPYWLYGIGAIGIAMIAVGVARPATGRTRR
ncbi:DUF4397 domain-containing protein [Actinokineospora guangxiensis]|uniref:DUF4397 domain-containing protein n=1 Tax=Actinokineospora guangxiensis TaxID=1490288 RepID=A0ABW0ETR1_9PSEU